VEGAAVTRWERECAEWQSIGRELEAAALAAGEALPSAYEVSREQKRRMWSRGERPMTCEEIVAELGGSLSASEEARARNWTRGEP
jgi:hypothetical protein